MKTRKNKEIVLTLGKVPSLNSFYAGSHWTKRKKAKDAALKEVKEQLGFNQGPPYNSFRVTANVATVTIWTIVLLLLNSLATLLKPWAGLRTIALNTFDSCFWYGRNHYQRTRRKL